jgi:uncharacterized repeat protein (TIGR02543 family)
MMRKMKFFGLLLSFFLLIGTGIGLSAAFGDITVKLTYNVDNVDIKQADFSQDHGTTLIHEAPQNVGDSGEFNYWLVNGILRSDLARNLSIVTRSTTELVAVYGHPTKPTVTFIDSNGKYINHLFVESGSVVASVPAAPGKPQSEFAGWKGLGSSVVISDPITTNTVFIATYTENAVTAELVVDGGTPTTYPINSVVSLTLGEGFTHWEDGDGNVLSYAETFKFSMLFANREVVRATGGVKAPVVNMIAETGLREGYTSYIGQFDSNGLDVIEYGFIISRSKDILTIDSLGATIIPSNVYNEQTNEFLRSFPEDSYNSIRAYAIFEGDVTVYSDYSYGSTAGTYATDLFISEYIEGSSNNKAIEIYNGTGQAVDLSNYNIKLYVNDATEPGKPISLSTTVKHGETFVIANTGSNTTILDLADLTSGSLTHNGNDAIGLFNGTTLIDIVGTTGTTADFAKDTTLVRKASINTPKTTWDSAEWDSYPIDTTEDLGTHTSNVPFVKHEIVYNNEGFITKDFVIDGSLIQDVSKEGYTFDGWFLEDTFETEFTGEVKQSLKLYAKFTIKSVTLTFDTDGGSLVDSITQNYGTAVTAPADPIKEGYTFVGWTPAIPTTMPAENQTFTAVWEANQYTVTFVTNGGDPVAEITQEFGTEVTLPTTVQDGFNFNGWYSDISLETLVESLVMPLEGITLYAGWVEASSTSVVSFMDGESTLFTEVVTIGTPVTRPTTDPTKDGYTFDDWYSDIGLTTLYNFETPVTTNTSVYARWIKIIYPTTYTETFDKITKTGTSYSITDSYTDDNNFAWTMSGKVDQTLDGKALTLGNAADKSFVQVIATGGISSFSLDVVRAFTNKNTRTLELFINDISYGTFSVDVNSDTAQQWTVNDINVEGNITIKVVSINTGSRGATIVDNFKWTDYPN